MQKKIVLWSDGAERITGHLRHEVIGCSCVGKSLLHCQQPGCEFCSEECPLARAIKTAQPVESSGFLGHTDSQPYVPSATYGNWELSADRANAARRVMQSHGVRSDQITQVRGFADQRLRKPDAPLDPANRRISVIVQYIVKNNDDDADRLSSGETKDPAAARVDK